MAVKQSLSLPQDLQAFQFDDELEKILLTAAHVGDLSGDKAFVSYSSLMIALQWSDDQTSRWLQSYIKENRIKSDVIFRHRGIQIERKKEILAKIDAGERPERTVRDTFSVSARTMFRNAAAISNETGMLNKPLSVRHLVAAYVFRNPASHKNDLSKWGFEEEKFRRAFAKLIVTKYKDESSAWEDVLRGYLPESVASSEDSHPGKILSGYDFDADSLKALRTVENLAATMPANLALSSEQLLAVLVEFGSGGEKGNPDCRLLYQTIFSDAETESGYRSLYGHFTIGPFSEMHQEFAEDDSKYRVGLDLKSVLDNARTISYSTTRAARIGIRHLIASALVEDNSIARKKLADIGFSLPSFRRALLRQFTHRWINDDGSEWRHILIGKTPPTMARFDNDEPEGDDRLDVTRFATAFATLLAAKKLQPPLSIGVFGDWGSGKSFFMRLMQRATEEVSGFSETDEDGNRLFCSRIVPISFNAWHYSESNLWASLVQTIFAKLQEAVSRKSPDEMLNKLSLAQEAREEAELQLRELETKKLVAEAEVTRIEDEIRAREQAVENIENSDVIEALKGELLEGKDVDQALEAAETYLGVKDAKRLKRDIAALSEVMDEAQIQAARARSNVNWLFQSGILKKLVPVVISLLALSGLALWLLWDHLNSIVAFINFAVANASALIAAVAARARPLIKNVSNGLNAMDGIRTRIEDRRSARTSERDAELEAAQRALRKTQSEVVGAEQGLALATAEIAKLETEKTSIRRIARLIERRLEGRDYERYLGIISAIHNDFKMLSELIPNMPTAGDASDDEFKPIERIVLYIDDLDRCPSDKVVSVFEAIHLMLAFPLFVVVVGVDIRWAGKSLHQHYPTHLDYVFEENGDKEPVPVEPRSASALDYLEKIFQVPFWLPPMDEEASLNMMNALVPPLDTGTMAVDSTPGEKMADIANSVVPEQAQTPAGGQAEDRKEAGGAEALSVDTREREFMLSLAGAVGKSPRRLKRFVNTYRILKASCDALERDTFVIEGGKSGTFKAAMTLLAIATGAPRGAIEILRKLRDFKDEDQLNKIDDYIKELAEKWQTEEMEYAKEAMSRYRAAYETEPLLKDLRYWVQRVARFSFRFGHL